LLKKSIVGGGTEICDELGLNRGIRLYTTFLRAIFILLFYTKLVKFLLLFLVSGPVDDNLGPVCSSLSKVIRERMNKIVNWAF